MRELWAERNGLPEACDNTLLIAERCNVEFNTSANYMPRFPRARGGVRGLLVRQGGREGAGLPLPPGHPRQGPQAGRVRDRRHHPDGLPGLLPRRRRLHQLGQGQRHPGRPGSWLRRRLDRGVRHAHHRPRPARARPDLRALPQPRPRLDARLRHRLRRPSPRRGHRLRLQEVRRRPGLDDRHLRHHQGQAGRQGLLAHPRLPLRDGRPGHQGDAGLGDGQGRPAQGDLRPQPPAVRRGRRVPGALRLRARREDRGRHRHRPRGPEAAVGRARRRRHHVQRAAARRHPDHAPPAGRRGHHAVRLPDLRAPRPDQDGLPGAAQPHRPRRRAAQHRVQPRREGRARGARADRREHLRAAPARRHPRRLPARRRPDAGAAAQHAARHVRGHLRGRRALPSRPDGRGLPQQVRPPQDRSRAGRGDPPRAGRGPRGRPGRDLRPDRLPGAGHGDRAEAGRLHARPGRPAASRHGQEEEVRAGQAVREVLRRHGRARVLHGRGRHAVEDPAAVLRLRLQQGPLRGVRPGLLLDRLPQGQLPAGVHGGAADLGQGRQGQVRDLPQRVPPDEDPGAPARRQRVRRRLHPGRGRRPLRPDRDPQRRRQRRRRGGAARAASRAGTSTSATSSARSTRWPATSASSSRSSRPAPSTP